MDNFLYQDSLQNRSATHPQKVQPHSARAQAMLMAFLSSVLILDVCRAAIWSAVCMFMNHYATTTASRTDTNFGKAILQPCLGRLQAPSPVSTACVTYME